MANGEGRGEGLSTSGLAGPVRGAMRRFGRSRGKTEGVIAGEEAVGSGLDGEGA